MRSAHHQTLPPPASESQPRGLRRVEPGQHARRRNCNIAQSGAGTRGVKPGSSRASCEGSTGSGMTGYRVSQSRLRMNPKALLHLADRSAADVAAQSAGLQLSPRGPLRGPQPGTVATHPGRLEQRHRRGAVQVFAVPGFRDDQVRDCRAMRAARCARQVKQAPAGVSRAQAGRRKIGCGVAAGGDTDGFSNESMST